MPSQILQWDTGSTAQRYSEQVTLYAGRIAQALPLVSYLTSYERLERPDQLSQAVAPNILFANYGGHCEPSLSTFDCSPSLNRHDLIGDLRNRVLTYSCSEQRVAQLILVPDLSPHLVDILGTALDINPIVFVSVLRDALNQEQREDISPDSIFHRENFRSTMFSYETDSIITTSYSCYSTLSDPAYLRAKLADPNTVRSVDKAFIEKMYKGGLPEQAIKALHPLLCSPLEDGPSGTVKFKRSYQVTSRITIYRISGAPNPLFLILAAHSSSRELGTQYLQEYDGLSNATPLWVDLQTNHSFEDSINSIATQVLDDGNPFTSMLYEEPTAASSHWKQEKQAKDHNTSIVRKLSSDFGFKDLFESFQMEEYHDGHCTYALNLWASSRALRALEKSLRDARDRLSQLVLSDELSERVSVATRTNILRHYRHTLFQTLKRINTNIKQLKISMSDNDSLIGSTEGQQSSDARDLIDQFRRLRMDAERNIDTNEHLIEDCLFDIQVELANTQLLESKKAMEQDASSKRLQVLAFIFLPVSTVASIFGMNVSGFVNVDVWKFVIATILVLALSLFIAAFNSIRALLSALEAAAFSLATWPSIKGNMYSAGYEPWYDRSKKEFWWRNFCWMMRTAYRYFIPLVSRCCVGTFAVLAFAVTPIELFWYQLFRWIEYGSKQEQLQKLRRLRVSDKRVRKLIWISVQSWTEYTTTLVWETRTTSYMLFPFMFFWAYIMYRVEPS